MTFEQLAIFIAVAEREHLTRAAQALHLTPSAVSASIKALETQHNVCLFERVGRGIELTREGRLFLHEAKEALARVRSAELVLSELGGLKRGRVDIMASQTITNHWLPPRLMRFNEQHPEIDIHLATGNTAAVVEAVMGGAAEIGFIEGMVERPALAMEVVTRDDLVIVLHADHEMASAGMTLAEAAERLSWAMREAGSGTRSEFEAALLAAHADPGKLRIAMTLPSNEAVLGAVRAGRCAAALSSAVVRPFVEAGQLRILDIALPPRNFTILRHRERHLSRAAARLIEFCRAPLTP